MNVVGWQSLNIGNSGFEYSWYQSSGVTERTLVDSDIALDPLYVTSSAQLTRVATHEWGHVIGLAHSNVEGALMSGPPDTAYSNLADLTPDDVNGCRCLYGTPDGLQAGYVCSLPDVIDFGTLSVGTSSSQSDVTVTNSGNATLTVASIRTNTDEFFVGTNGCAPSVALAPGASCTFGLMARRATAGERNDEVTIDTSEGPIRTALRVNGITPLPSLRENFGGIWSTAPAGSESGWGINFTHQGDLIFASWFTYDAGGQPWWVTMTAQEQSDGSFTGPIDLTTGPPFNAVPFDPAHVTHTTVGTGRLIFSDANNGTFAYTVNGIAQTKTLARFQFATPVPTCTFNNALAATQASNYQDMWAVPDLAEAGWGINFTHQGDLIFASWFTYDASGQPWWVTATLTKTTAGTYSGGLDTTTGPPLDSVPFDPSRVTHSAVGTATVTFTDGANATFVYTLNGVSQTKPLTRFVFRAPGTVCQ